MAERKSVSNVIVPVTGDVGLAISGVPAYGQPALPGLPANRYDIKSGIYNYKSTNTRILQQGLGRAMMPNGGMTEHLIIGDSISAGAVSAIGTFIYDRLRAWPLAMRDQLAVLGIPANGTGMVRCVDSVTDPRWVFSGSWVGFTCFVQSNVLSSYLELTADRPGTCFDFWYNDGSTGTFSVAVDGAVAGNGFKSVTMGGTSAWKYVRLYNTTINVGSKIRITVTTVGTNGLFTSGGSVWTPNAGLVVHNAAQTGALATGTGATAWNDVSASSALGIVYNDVGGRRRTVSDAATTSGSPNLTSATAAWVANDLGKPIDELNIGSGGRMFPDGCFIGSVTSGTVAVVYQGIGAAAVPVNAYATLSSQQISIGRDPTCVHIALGVNDLSTTDGAIQTAITTIRNRYPLSDCILHLEPEFSTAYATAPRQLSFQKAIYALADTLDVPLYDWRDRVGTFTNGAANGVYGDQEIHLTGATEADVGSALAMIIGGGSGRQQAVWTPVLPLDATNKTYVDGKTAGNKISALTAVTTPVGTDVVPVVNGGATKGLSLTQINAYCEPISVASVANQTPAAATDVYLTDSGIAIPQTRIQARTFVRWRIFASKTAAGTATPIFVIRHGTAKTTSDAARCTITCGAQTAVINAGCMIEVLATFRSVGSGTSAVLQGAVAQGVAGFHTIGGVATSSGFDSTVASTFLGLSVNTGTSAAWTITLVQADLLNII